MGKIRVLSFDLDNCLFNVNYVWNNDAPEDDAIIKSNLPLLETLLSQKTRFNKTVVLVGSNRQSKSIDDELSEHQYAPTESGFNAIIKVAEFLEAELDPFLMADIYGRVHSGTSFKRAIASVEPHPGWCFDKSKLSILYAQMHKMAEDYPFDAIEFNFHDDKGLLTWGEDGENLLEDLAAFFQKYPTMIPHNITLNLFHYDGKGVTPYQPIQGKGPRNYFYRNTVWEMALLTLNVCPPSSMYSFISHVVPSQLTRYYPVPMTPTRHGFFGYHNPLKPAIEPSESRVATNNSRPNL